MLNCNKKLGGGWLSMTASELIFLFLSVTYTLMVKFDLSFIKLNCNINQQSHVMLSLNFYFDMQ